jgi:hypothetical protein
MSKLQINVESSCMDLSIVVPERHAPKKLKEIKKHYEMLSLVYLDVYIRKSYDYRKRKYVQAHYKKIAHIKEGSYIKIKITKL